MSRKTDFVVGKQQLFSTSPYSRELTAKKNKNNLIKPGVGHI